MHLSMCFPTTRSLPLDSDIFSPVLRGFDFALHTCATHVDQGELEDRISPTIGSLTHPILALCLGGVARGYESLLLHFSKLGRT